MEIVKSKLCDIHDLSLTDAADSVTQLSKSDDLNIVVTPNIDHFSRLIDKTDPLADVYKESTLCICDSKILQKLYKLKSKPIQHVVPGSTLTQHLFDHTLDSSNKILIIGGNDAVISKLRSKYSELNIDHYNPPMGFINDATEVQKTVDYCIQSSSRYHFLAVGSPRQEILASKLKETREVSGVALCIGASILFLVDEEKRAPQWMQKAHLEWFYRMMQDPGRLAKSKIPTKNRKVTAK